MRPEMQKILGNFSVGLLDKSIGLARRNLDTTPMGDYIAMGEGIANRDPLGFGLGLAGLAIPGTIRPGAFGNVKGFHGTADAIKKFKKRLWLSDTPDLANEYALARQHMSGTKSGANVMPVEAYAGTSFDADKLPKTVSVSQFFNEALGQAKKNKKQVDLIKAKKLLEDIRASEIMPRPGYTRDEFWYQPQEAFGDVGSAKIDELFNVLGFDSIKMTEKGAKTYGILDPDNVMSVFDK